MSLLKLLLTLSTLSSSLSWAWTWDPPNFTRPKRANDGLLRAPMRRRTPPRPLAGQLTPTSKKKPAPTPEGVGVAPFMRDLTYLITLGFGFPEQLISLGFDTGSSECWVNPSCSDYAAFGYPTYYQACLSAGFYLTQQTETGKSLNVSADISYGSGFVEVEYWRDSVSFPEINGSSFKLRHAQFGVATDSLFLEVGVFGAAHGKGYNQNYSSFIDDLYDQGYIQDKDFSVSLGAVDADNGEIVFGGYDTSKFTGYFQRLPLVSQMPDDDYFRYWVNCTYIGVTPSYSCESYPASPPGWSDRMLLDTGTSLIYLPETLFYNVLAYFPSATFSDREALYEVPCDAMWQQGSVDFTFSDGGSGSVTIQVPFHEFIYVIEAMPENNYTQECFLGVQPSFGFNIGGDVLLRSMYLMFSQMDKSVYMAQASNCGTNIVSSHGIGDDVWGDCAGPYGGPDAFSSICETASSSPFTTAGSSADSVLFSDGPAALGTHPPYSAAAMSTAEASADGQATLIRRDAPVAVVVATRPTMTAAAAETPSTRNSSATTGFKTSRKTVSPIEVSTPTTSTYHVTVPFASSREQTSSSSSSSSSSSIVAPCESSTESASPESTDYSSDYYGGGGGGTSTDYEGGSVTTSDFGSTVYPPAYTSKPEGYSSVTGFDDGGPVTTMVESLVCYPTDSARVVIRVTPGQTIIVSDKEGSETIVDGTRAFTVPLPRDTAAVV